METFVLSKQVRFLPINGTGTFVAFHSFFGNAIKIEKETYLSLLSLDSPHSRRKISQKFSISRETLNHLVAIGFLESSDENIEAIIKERLQRRLERAQSGLLIRSLRFLSSYCNIACKYCSIAQLQPEKTTKTKFTASFAIEAARKFIEMVKAGGHKTAHIRFFGGEPLLDWIAYKAAIFFLEGEREDVELKFTLNTNGVLITDEIAKFLKEHAIITIISLDGTQNQHDVFRKFRTGEGTYKHVKNGIEILQRNNVQFKLNATLHNENINRVGDIVAVAKSFGVTDLGIDNLCFLENDKAFKPADIHAKTQAIISAYEFGKKIGVNVSGAWTGFRSFTKEKNPIPYCFGNGEELCINAEGQIFPCYGFQEPIGTIEQIRDCFSHPLYLELATRIPGNIPFCNGCEFQGPCAGECAADMILIKSPSYLQNERCKIRRELFKYLLISTATELT